GACAVPGLGFGVTGAGRPQCKGCGRPSLLCQRTGLRQGLVSRLVFPGSAPVPLRRLPKNPEIAPIGKQPSRTTVLSQWRVTSDATGRLPGVSCIFPV